MSDYVVNGHSRFQFPIETEAHYMKITTPSGQVEIAPAFKNLPHEIHRDDFGYTAALPVDDAELLYEARYTAREPGVFKYEVCRVDDSVALTGSFEAVEKGLNGYIEVSKHDARFFAYDNGRCFVPIGVTLDAPKLYDAPGNDGHYVVNGKSVRTRGIREYRRVIKRMAENGANLLKICIASPILDARTINPETYDYGAFAVLDAIIEECREKDIKVMMTFDKFCALHETPGVPKDRTATRIDTRFMRPFNDLLGCLKSETFCIQWLVNLKGYIYRYGNDPTVFAFELWDEIDRVPGITIQDIARFTNHVGAAVRACMPRTMVSISLSACDTEDKIKNQRYLHNCPISFDQVHRFFDKDAELEECGTSMQDMARTAIEELRYKQRPLLMTATGAVNSGTEQPFMYYGDDYSGIVFRDTVFTPFFAGAAGTGIILHSDYIDQHNLWEHFKAFSEMVNSVKADKQRYKYEYYRRKHYTMMVMKGRTTTLVYIRNLLDNWERMLRDDYRLIMRRGIRIQTMGGSKAKAFVPPGESMPTDLVLKNGEFWIPPFGHSVFLRIR